MSNTYTESNYPPGWQKVQYRWDVAWGLIRSIDMERTLAAVGLLHTADDHVDLATTSRREWRRHWDRHCRG